MANQPTSKATIRPQLFEDFSGPFLDGCGRCGEPREFQPQFLSGPLRAHRSLQDALDLEMTSNDASERLGDSASMVRVLLPRPQSAQRPIRAPPRSGNRHGCR